MAAGLAPGAAGSAAVLAEGGLVRRSPPEPPGARTCEAHAWNVDRAPGGARELGGAQGISPARASGRHSAPVPGGQAGGWRGGGNERGRGSWSSRPGLVRVARASSRLSLSLPAAAAAERHVAPPDGGAARGRRRPRQRGRYLVDSASSHMLVSKIKPCMCKYKQSYKAKLRMAH